MNRFTAILTAIVIWITATTAPCAAAALQNYEDHIRRRVQVFGVGAEMEVLQFSGKETRGSVLAFDDVGFELSAGKRPARFAYVDVREVRVKRLVYPDPSTRADRVRRAIEAFGIGEHIKVKLTSKKTRHGTIWQPQDDVFTFVPDNSAGRLPIAYDEVVELQPTVAPRPRQGRHPLVKFGIAYGVLMAFIWIGSGSNGGLP